MREKIVEILNRIKKDLLRQSLDSPSLLAGEAGTVLFLIHYNRFSGEAQDIDELGDCVQRVAEAGVLMQYPTFCGGKSGINWLYSYMYRHEMLDEESYRFLVTDNQVLAAEALAMLERDNYDFLHGASGIAYQLLDTETPDETFCKDFINRLQQLFEKNGGEVPASYVANEHRAYVDKVNLGLSHGITSILKLCIAFYNKGMLVPETKKMIHRLTDFLCRHVNEDRSVSYFPNEITGGKTKYAASRLGWCYGDLTIGYVLLEAAALLNDDALHEFSLEVLVHSAGRREYPVAMIMDAGLCHGSAGVMHVYNRLWRRTGIAVFGEAMEFWKQQTLAFCEVEESNCFKKYDSEVGGYVEAPGLLEGAAGVGLALISYLTGDFEWDYCLMLND